MFYKLLTNSGWVRDECNAQILTDDPYERSTGFLLHSSIYTLRWQSLADIVIEVEPIEKKPKELKRVSEGIYKCNTIRRIRTLSFEDLTEIDKSNNYFLFKTLIHYDLSSDIPYKEASMAMRLKMIDIFLNEKMLSQIIHWFKYANTIDLPLRKIADLIKEIDNTGNYYSTFLKYTKEFTDEMFISMCSNTSIFFVADHISKILYHILTLSSWREQSYNISETAMSKYVEYVSKYNSESDLLMFITPFFVDPQDNFQLPPILHSGLMSLLCKKLTPMGALRVSRYRKQVLNSVLMWVLENNLCSIDDVLDIYHECYSSIQSSTKNYISNRIYDCTNILHVLEFVTLLCSGEQVHKKLKGMQHVLMLERQTNEFSKKLTEYVLYKKNLRTASVIASIQSEVSDSESHPYDGTNVFILEYRQCLKDIYDIIVDVHRKVNVRIT